MIESKLWHSKIETKIVKSAKMWDLSKLVTNILASLILVIFSALWGILKKLWLGEMGNFLVSGGGGGMVTIRTWKRVLLGSMSENE